MMMPERKLKALFRTSDTMLPFQHQQQRLATVDRLVPFPSLETPCAFVSSSEYHWASVRTNDFRRAVLIGLHKCLLPLSLAFSFLVNTPEFETERKEGFPVGG